MIDICCSAPGKVIVAGEYAVLDGAPAICMAVNRRARVTITSSEDGDHSVHASGGAASQGRFTADRGRIRWRHGGEAFALLEAVWRELLPAAAVKLSIGLDSTAFVDSASTRKLGIGSSAALCVALAAALDRVDDGQRDIGRVAAAAHRRFQGGAGSGADVACSHAGGLIEFRSGERPARSLQWPQGLHYALFWSGVAAGTAGKLAKLASSRTGATRSALFAASTSVATAWSGGDAGRIFAALRDYTTALQRFDVDHDLGIFDAGHSDLLAVADDIVYKPCGAGGGDVGIAVAMSAAAITAFAGVARQRGFTPVRMNMDLAGVTRHRDRA